MKLTVNKALEINRALAEFGKITLPGAVAYRVAKNIKKLNEIVSSFEAVQIDLLKKYCKLDKSGEPLASFGSDGKITYPYKDAKAGKKYEQEINEILEKEEDVNLELIPLESIERIDISPRLLVLLMPIIQEKNE